MLIRQWRRFVLLYVQPGFIGQGQAEDFLVGLLPADDARFWHSHPRRIFCEERGIMLFRISYTDDKQKKIQELKGLLRKNC